MAARRDQTPAKARGDIQAGTTRDKTPGFDPAAAPGETDAEAADVPTSVAEARPRRQPEFTNEASFGDAMRPTGSEPGLQPGKNWPVLVIAAVVFVAAAAFVLAAMLR
ncbi:hypothetical protein [Mesorhizobium sp.]|uniref:hypothetical protein n=1 Tax=Mesorhizobium sp. TaxID=1871066 RepID=UPI000FE6C2B9|nr:hypothetical protein [Mesorhizobium sp.]RWP22920.1 MAG: hypothetical protein EOR01_10895 [Mesorhizobium sp.]TIL46360.1 MAG: hypothetical protein E5Y86_07035 [Mesorhizobium sp.]TIL62215.1 MAG: hypothetical protein E5Y79_04420 [Mesorhizobium sp.]TIL90258.1 MAG: hypothetical protein E5Y73_19695 [Mesorhizobium sp.]TIM15419.1 MAG: hypothetical protein E5Y67_07295 [Mesorhizobium sp.]